MLLNNLDTTPAVITLSATPNFLWPANGRMVPVAVSGTISDAGSGVNADSATYVVEDEYGNIQPKGAVSPGAGGSFSFTILLQASRLGSDLDGRRHLQAQFPAVLSGHPSLEGFHDRAGRSSIIEERLGAIMDGHELARNHVPEDRRQEWMLEWEANPRFVHLLASGEKGPIRIQILQAGMQDALLQKHLPNLTFEGDLRNAQKGGTLLECRLWDQPASVKLASAAVG